MTIISFSDFNDFSDPDTHENHFEFDTLYEVLCSDKLRHYIDKISGLKAQTNVIVLDWDDTILPTTWLVSDCGLAIESINPPELTDTFYQRLLHRHDIIVADFFDALLDIASPDDIHIITNSVDGWVIESAKMYLPLANDYLNKFKITSTRMSSDDSIRHCMKYETIVKLFGNLLDPTNVESTKNVIAIGDSTDEINSINRFTDGELNIITKTVKFQNNPSINHLMDELNFMTGGFKYIYKCKCNLSITISQGLFDDAHVSMAFDK